MRCQKNPQYSLRAFARSLDLESSFLSKLLSGKRNITPEVFKKISAKLSFDLGHLKFSEPNGYSSITEDQISILAQWEHLAILEILANKTDANVKKLAANLGITELRVKQALERLTNVGYIAFNADTKKFDVLSPKNSTEGLPVQQALQNLQKQFLQMALQAIDDVPDTQRDQSGMTMMVDTGRIPEARKIIKKFRRDMSKLLEGTEKKDQVYQLSVSLYPLSKTPWKK